MRPGRLAPSAAVAALAVLIGCGGYQASQNSGPKGRAVVKVAWPKAGARLIPNAALSLVVTATKDGQAVGSVRIQRPTATATLTGLPYGTLGVTIKAYPTASGTGVAQALGAGEMTVAEDEPGQFGVALESSVKDLAITPAAVTLVRGATVSVGASAKDKDGAIVLLAVGTAAEALTWKVTPPSAATVVGTGPTVALTGNVEGDATISASLKVKDNGTTVESVEAPVRVMAPLVAAGLPSAGYPVAGGDYGGSGQGRGPAAAGSVGTAVSVGTSSAYSVVGPDNTLYALSNTKLTASGAVNWEIPTGTAAYGLALTSAGTLIVSTASGIDARLATDGALAWSFQPAGGNAYAPTVGRDGTVYVTADKLYALDGATGAVRWTRAVVLKSRLAIGPDDTLYGQASGAVTAFDPASGATKWSVSPYGTDTGYSTPVVVGDTVYVKSGKNNRANVRSLSRTPLDLGEYQGGGGSDDTLTEQGDGGRVITGGVTASTGRVAGTTGIRPSYTYYTFVNVTALNTADGARRWTYPFPSRRTTSTSVAVPTLGNITGGPVALSGARVFAIDEGYAVGLDRTSGAQAWRIGSSLSSYSGGPAVANDGTVYLSGHAGSTTLLAVDPATGATRWSASLGASALGAPTLADDGTVYVGTTTGKVVPIR